MVAKPGFVTIPKDRPTWIPLLRRIYEFESDLVSGPGSSVRSIKGVLWTESQLAESLDLKQSDLEEARRLISYLLKERQMMRIPSHGDTPETYISRMAETVRLLGHTYEYWHRGRPSINAVRWLTEDKKIPRRGITPIEFISRVKEAMASRLNQESDTYRNLCEAVEMVIRDISKSISKGRWEDARYSEFQLETTIDTLTALYGRERFKAEVISAGVGAGKTLAFALPILISALESVRGPPEFRRCFLLVYPRKALAQDQAKTITGYVRAIDNDELEAHFEHSSVYDNVARGLERKYGAAGPPPAIIITTFETLKRRLQHPSFIKKVTERLSCVVFDEIHLAEGLGGAHISVLANRLRQAASSRRVFWVAASATIARPDEHASRIFGIPTSQVRVVSPHEDDLMSVGLIHHVFLRPSGAVSNLGALINATSLFVRCRRGDVGKRVNEDDVKRPKTLAFADNLDTLGRWNADLRENERTEVSADRPHPQGSANPNDWKDRRLREIPYAQRFRRPLERRIEVFGGKGEQGRVDEFEEVLRDWRGKHVCTSCMAGERIEMGRVDMSDLKAMSKVVHRWPHFEKDRVKAFWIDSPVFRQNGADVGTLDLCPYLQAGACIWFSQEEDDEHDERMTEEISEDKHYFEWRSVVRSTIHSSKRAEARSESDGDLAEIVFQDSIWNIYGVGSSKAKMPVDIVLASPSLEVGIDLPMVTESIMMNAIRSVASYRQKAGRIGREPGLDVLNVVLMSDSPVDLHYYRQPRKLTSLGQLDPIPLKDRNTAILLCGLYLSIWDWLALNTDLPESVPKRISRTDGSTDFSARLRESLSYLKMHRNHLAHHLEGVSRQNHGAESGEVQGAINQAIAELELLLSDAAGTIKTRPEYSNFTLADVMIYVLAANEGVTTLSKHGRALEDLYQEIDEYESARMRIHSIPVELRAEFEELDMMSQSGAWNPARLDELARTLSNWPGGNDDSGSVDKIHNLAERFLVRVSEGISRHSSNGFDCRVFATWEQYKNLVKTKTWQPYYLSTIMQLLPIFGAVRLDPWFVRPENLFSNPYEPHVRLMGDAPENQQAPSVSEALFGYIPGTWSYRIPHECYKVRCGMVEVGPGGQSVMSMDKLTAAGNTFKLKKKSLPPPPGVDGEIDIYVPVNVSLLRVRGKYVFMDRRKGVALDGDEAHPQAGMREDESSQRSKRSKIPRSYLSKWVYVDEPQGERALPLMPEEGRLAVEKGTTATIGFDALKEIRHPMFARHMSEIRWHDHLTVTEYVYSVDRLYSGSGNRDGIELSFRDRFGPIGFGDSYETEGISLTLNSETLKEYIAETKAQMESGQREWAPSLLKAFRAYLSELPLMNGGRLSPFMIEDITSLVLDAGFDGENGITFDSLLESLRTILADKDTLKERAKRYYSLRYGLLSADSEASSGAIDTPNAGDIDLRVSRLDVAVTELTNSLSEFQPYLEKWIRLSILNTLGVVALTSLQQYSGARDHDVGYAVDPQAENGGLPRIYLYDRAAFGNGCCSTAHKYMHILHILRHGETASSTSLPTDDFLSILEERLLQCPQFHIDMNALYLSENAGGDSRGMNGLGDIEEQAREVLRVSKDVWKAIGVTGLRDAWKIPLTNVVEEFVSDEHGIAIDDLARATNICWNGCPECIDRSDLVTGGLSGRYSLDKAILDAWFAKGRQSVAEYTNVDFKDLAEGRAHPDIGALTRVRLDLDQPTRRRLRAVHVPWTIGFEIDRSAIESNAKMVMRTSDVLDLRFSEQGGNTGASVGVGSVGFKRLLWFDLVMTAYLDVLNLLKDERKELKLVYYDCRDIDFDDVGLSARMIDAIVGEMRKTGTFNRLEKLSDILLWLLRRGFRISLCVDEKRSEEQGVRELLMRLSGSESPRMGVFTKAVERGHMHKKALLTPIAVLKGSANLTKSGSHNEEIVDHFFYGTDGYMQSKINIDDTFYGAEVWRR